MVSAMIHPRHTLRLILLMVCSACVGFVFSQPIAGSSWMLIQQYRERLVVTVAAAFVGLATELGLRLGEQLKNNEWRFSLRTLLIATTLVAVLLGTIIYFAH
jgi:hypothetical protein